MIIFKYPSKKELKANIGKPLRYIETSLFGPEYTPNGSLTGANQASHNGPRAGVLCGSDYGKRLIKGVK
jgi:hypothetical protein